MAIAAMWVFVVSSSCGGDDSEAVFSAISGLNGKWELTSIDIYADSGDSIIQKRHQIINKDDFIYCVLEFKSSGNLIKYSFDNGRLIVNDTVQYHVENGCVVLIYDGVEERWPFRVNSNSLFLIIEKDTIFGIESWVEYVFKRMK